MMSMIMEWFSSYSDMARAVDYLMNHISYNFNNNRDSEFIKFNKSQLKFLIISKYRLSPKQIDKVISVACTNVASNNKTGLMVTKNSIYLAVC